MKTLVIIGNGFDIGHGLKTSFKEFILSKSYYKEKYSHFQSGNGNWNEIESKFKRLILEQMSLHQTEVDVEELVDNLVDEYGFDKYGEIAYYDFRSESFKEDIESIAPLVYSLINFESDFKHYLCERYNDVQLGVICKAKSSIADILNKADEIVSFNYTNVVEVVYGINGVLHIHGNINDEIVIGCDAFSRLEESLVYGEYPNGAGFGRPKDILVERLKFWEYDDQGNMVESASSKRFFDEVMSKTKKNEEELLRLLEMKSKEYLPQRKAVEEKVCKHYYDEVHIIGHSLGAVDYGFFEKIKAGKIYCYYHATEDDSDYNNKKEMLDRNNCEYELIKDTKIF